jgi:hypothetical protein
VTDVDALQLTWFEGDVLAWQPGRGTYGGNLAAETNRLTRRSTPWRYGDPAMRIVELHLPTGRQRVMCQRLDLAAIDALADIHSRAGDVSASVAWFGDVFRLVRRVVDDGAVVPRLQPVGSGVWQTSWQMSAEHHVAITSAIAPAMPPVAHCGTAVTPADIIDALTDQVTRVRLSIIGWRPPLGQTRRPAAKAMRLVAKALADPTHGGRIHALDMLADLDAIARSFDDLRRRDAGEPVVRARLRLDLPADDADPVEGAWPLTLEVVDVDDTSRWCTAADIVDRAPPAAALAGRDEHHDLLAQAIDSATHALVKSAPFLSTWAGEQSRGVSLDDAAAVLEVIDGLHDGGIELIAPQRLTRRTPTTRGVAQPTGGPGSGRLGFGALVDWQVVVDGTDVPEEALRRAADDGSTLIRLGGRWVQIDRAEARRALANLAEHRAEHSELDTIELLRLAAEARIEIAPPDESMTTEAADWMEQLLGGLPDAALGEGEVPESFNATLRHYQRRGLAWLQFLRSVGLGGCLADDMGLGKTPTTLAHLAGIDGPHLVVCPLSVVRNWQSEAARFTPLLRVMIHHGTGRRGADDFAAHVAAHDLVVTTYQIATRDIDVLSAVRWSTAVFDEAQAVKNAATRTARAMRTIPAAQRVALTGTPVENRLSELWSILSITTPGLLGNAAQFKSRYSDPIERERSADATAALRTLTGPFLLRRTKADKRLVPDLPDKVEQLAWAPLTKEQARLYQGVVDQLLHDAQQQTGMRRRGLVLAALTRLKQICNHPAHALGDGSRLSGRSGKLNRFDELVADLLDAGEQALVFTQFREMGHLLQQHLGEQFGQRVPFLHGGVARTGRDRMVDAFQQGTAAPLLIVSLKAGGTGLNLTAASRVVHYDRWWNPAVEDQATDRAWRIGQRNAVFVHKLVCQGTIEERVDALIADKKALADAVVGTTGEAWLSELTTDALRDLVRLDASAVMGRE